MFSVDVHRALRLYLGISASLIAADFTSHAINSLAATKKSRHSLLVESCVPSIELVNDTICAFPRDAQKFLLQLSLVEVELALEGLQVLREGCVPVLEQLVLELLQRECRTLGL